MKYFLTNNSMGVPAHKVCIFIREITLWIEVVHKKDLTSLLTVILWGMQVVIKQCS